MEIILYELRVLNTSAFRKFPYLAWTFFSEHETGLLTKGRPFPGVTDVGLTILRCVEKDCGGRRMETGRSD